MNENVLLLLSKIKLLDGKNGNCQPLVFWAPKSLQMVTAAMKFKDACSLEGKQ